MQGDGTIPGNIRRAIPAFAGALVYGGALAVSFSYGLGFEQHLFMGLFAIGLVLPIYRGEYILGFVLGMMVTFGGVLPMVVAAVVVSISWAAHVVFRAGMRLFSSVKRAQNGIGHLHVPTAACLMHTSHPRVALVTCAAYPDLFEDDLLLARALEDLDINPIPATWDDLAIDWLSFDALVIRTPWDYFERAAEFRAWLDARIASGVLLCNAGEILDWNYDKRYLQDLEAAGVPLVPTVCIGRGEQADVAALARARGWNEIVVKPTISGGAYRTYRFFVEDAAAYQKEIEDTLADRGVLVQPFLPEILSAGELSMLFFDGVYSHAVCKRPRPGDYRVQFQFGGTIESVEIEPALVAQARACVLAAPSLPVYARVDGLVKDGRFLLMELEVFEPLMFLASHPEAPGRFARAVHGRVLAR